MANPTYFNAEYYLESNPDVLAAGFDVNNVYEGHFVPFGMTELRAPNADYAGKITPESLLVYALANPDLQAAFGIAADATSLTQAQSDALVVQYWNFGITEDRPGALVDANPETDHSDLVKALVALQEATAEQTANLKEAAKNEAVADELTSTEPTNDEIVLAIDEAIDTLADDVAAAASGGSILTGQLGQNGGNPLSDAQQNKLIKVAGDELAAETAVAQAQVSSVAGLSSAASALTNAAAQYVKAADKLVKDNASLTGELAKVGALNGGAATVAVTVADLSTFEILLGTDALIEVDATSKKLVKTPASVGVEGFDALFAAAQAAYASLQAEQTAATNFDNAANATFGNGQTLTANNTGGKLTVADDLAITSAANELGSFIGTDANGTKVGDLNDAKLAEAEFKAAVEKYNEVKAFSLQNKEDVKAINAATDALEDLGFVVAVDNVGTEGDDLFVYEADADSTQIAYDFGVEGTDVFFFGLDYTFVALDGKDAGTERVGDKDVLEIFAQQEGANVVLYVETETFGGNQEGNDDLVKVEIIGVNLDDLAFEGGFLQFA